MFILVQYFTSKQEVNGDSNYIVNMQMIKAIMRQRKDWHFFFLFPDSKTGYTYIDEGAFAHKNITRIPWRISTRRHAAAISFDGDFYDSIFKNLAIDAVLCSAPEVAGHIKFAGTNGFGDYSRPAMIAAHHYVIHDSLPYPFENYVNVALAQVSGGFLADHNVFNSDHCAAMFYETAGKFLNAAAINSIKQRSSKINLGVLDRAEIGERKGDNEVPIIAYNHRLQGYKNWKTTFEVFEKLYAEGLKFKVRYTSDNYEQTIQIRSLPFVEICICPKRKDYLAKLAECDLNTTNSQHETFCVAAIESMAYGQPVIAPNGITFPEITGRATNHYPYLFNSIEEQADMLRVLIKNKDLRRKMGATLKQHVWDSYSIARYGDDWIKRIEQMSAERQPNVSAEGMAILRRVAKEHNGATLKDFANVVWKQKTSDGTNTFGPQSMSFVKLMRALRQIGVCVVFDKGAQRVAV